jgi:uncharacterized protein
VTARLLFRLSAVLPGEMVPIDGGEALSQLKAGRIDAMFYVAGYPVRLLKEEVTVDDGLALIPISSKSIRESYAPAEIPGSTYEWQTTPVSTVSVKAVLVSADSRHRECDSVGRFAQHVARGMERLTRLGHPRWKLVDLDFPLSGWDQYDCVRKYLAPQTTPGASPRATPASRNPVADAIRGVLGND